VETSRPFRIITGVLRELLRTTGRKGFALAGEGPEATLLSDWMERARLPLVMPSDGEVRSAWHLLGGNTGKLEPALERTRSLAALATAVRRDLLLASADSKTMLVLAPQPRWETVFPLGDLYAHEIHSLVGACSLPDCLEGANEETLARVDGGLKDYLERHIPFDKAFGGVPPALAVKIRASLVLTRRSWYPRTLVPKLTNATLGLDLDL
jgi:hypothetical protein